MPESIPIVCPYCGVGCNLELTLDEKGIPKRAVLPAAIKSSTVSIFALKDFPFMSLSAAKKEYYTR
jgi:anaerobic selenocysteine-containing dehydrogenase